MRQLRPLYSITRNDNYIGKDCAISISRIDATFQGPQLPCSIVLNISIFQIRISFRERIEAIEAIEKTN